MVPELVLMLLLWDRLAIIIRMCIFLLLLPLCDAVWLDLSEREGVSDSYLWVYPPGIPLLLPGERITEEIKNHLEMLKNSGISPKIIKTS